ncbi:lysophospholipid acyltransferase family protein [Pseudochryseolinea flava]|uniref:1-acyl-sn-glycerol-3-phosphate acyltransferase n=1 Tax=Pseudochryseolinea flava TaxID=2059302 RepID=A0A364XUC9_9BACT|nr:lysophospholipid acyltransferase family protein [Pseudochryseolinea flava]RAV97775.1 1-acyl-sn-glycerol-3-phosphate acyltransferase [Pseudochryseolinea flava]
MRFVRTIHTYYGFGIFVITFFIAFPILLVPIIFPRAFRLVGVVNRWWARTVFTLVFLPFRVEYREKLKRKQSYIFCPNHFSYIDIPTMGLNHHNTIFVGKNDYENIPLFGYMYRKLHITVDRSKLKSRATTVKRSLAAIDDGKSLVIFPEGGIITEKDPVLARFKDGAFRMAIEKQIPIVPVTIPHNWIILPPDEFLLRWHPMKVIFHEPIQTKGMTLDQVATLKAQVFEIIHTELQRHLSHENRPHLVG